jgi:hypothetical protein
MSEEMVKVAYKWAVIVLAAVAVVHFVKGCGKKGKGASGSQPTPAQQVNPTWWAPGPVVAPRAASRKNHMSLGF